MCKISDSFNVNSVVQFHKFGSLEYSTMYHARCTKTNYILFQPKVAAILNRGHPYM